MEQGIRNPGLREAMDENSKLSERDPAELKAYDLIVDALATVLEPGERVVAYADRDVDANQIDALAYDAKAADEMSDVLGYEAGGIATTRALSTGRAAERLAAAALAEADLETLATLWVGGAEISWATATASAMLRCEGCVVGRRPSSTTASAPRASSTAAGGTRLQSV